MFHVSPLQKLTALSIFVLGSTAQADCLIQKEYCSGYNTTVGEVYLKDLNRALLAGSIGKENVIETSFLGLPVLSVEEANELLTHLLFGLCHTSDFKSAAKGATVALTAAKVTSYLVSALNNLGIKLPKWIQSNADIHYHATTLLKGSTRKIIRQWLHGLCC